MDIHNAFVQDFNLIEYPFVDMVMSAVPSPIFRRMLDQVEVVRQHVWFVKPFAKSCLDTGGQAVGDDIVYLAAVLFQVPDAILYFRSIWQFLGPP